MSGLSNLIVCFCVFIILFHPAECQVTVTNLNGTGNFLCGYSTRLECAIPVYGGGMSWKLDGTLIAQCAFGSCDPLGALPSGDNFTADETAKMFNLDIGITHADNGTMYQCDDSSNQDQTTVNIQVPPSESAFNMTVSVTGTTLKVEAGCFYPSNAGKMDVFCVSGGNEIKVRDNISMTPSTTGCTGDCAGPNIYTATGTTYIYNSTGSSSYRVKVYLDGFKSYAVIRDTPAIYNCESEVTVTNINESFICGHSTSLECDIRNYWDGMAWKLDGTIVAQCAFGSCTALGALPSGDSFTYDESAGKFYLDIGITHADNGTQYQCDDGLNQDQTTVNIQVPPSESAFTMTVSVTGAKLTAEAGCFYPSIAAAKMDLYCVKGGIERKVVKTIYMVPTTNGCRGDCAGPNIYTATGSITIDITKGSSKYRAKTYLDGFKKYTISKDTPAIYNCDLLLTVNE